MTFNLPGGVMYCCEHISINLYNIYILGEQGISCTLASLAQLFKDKVINLVVMNN